ncbi:hypothetical protein C8T65DRAFT_730705 [Cerioporus squamosus]|nr:hypothetical protein C8T65DRAFT_730705 [Cerioporus squamosus]
MLGCYFTAGRRYTIANRNAWSPSCIHTTQPAAYIRHYLDTSASSQFPSTMTSKSSFRRTTHPPYRLEDSPMRSLRHPQQTRQEPPHEQDHRGSSAPVGTSSSLQPFPMAMASASRSQSHKTQAEEQQPGEGVHVEPSGEEQGASESVREGSVRSLISYSMLEDDPLLEGYPNQLHRSSQVAEQHPQYDASTPDEVEDHDEDHSTTTASQHELDDGDYGNEDGAEFMREDTSDSLYRNEYTPASDQYDGDCAVDTSDRDSEGMVIDVESATEMQGTQSDDESAGLGGAVSADPSASAASQPGMALPMRDASLPSASQIAPSPSPSHTLSPERLVPGDTRTIAVRLLHNIDQETLPPIEVDMRDLQGLRVSLARLSLTPMRTQLTVFTQWAREDVTRHASSPPGTSLPPALEEPEDAEANGQTPAPQLQPGDPRAASSTPPVPNATSVRGSFSVENEETLVETSDYYASTPVPHWQHSPTARESASRADSVADTDTGRSGTGTIRASQQVLHGQRLGTEASDGGSRLSPWTDISVTVKSEPLY